MAIIPIPYAQFIAQNSILSTNGGSWRCAGFAERNCSEDSASWSNNQTVLESHLEGNDSVGTYSMSLQTTVLLDMASFGNGDQVSYSWLFLATGLSDQVARDPLLLSSSVGNITYLDVVPVQDRRNNETWSNASYYLHTGNVFPQGEGRNLLLDLSFNISISHLPSEWVGLNLRHIGLGLGSPTPSPLSTTVTSSTTTNDAVSTKNTAILVTGIPTIANNAIPAANPNTNAMIIATAVLSGILCLVLLLLAWLLWKRRQQRRRVSISKVRNVKRASPLPRDNYQLDVLDISRHDPGIITPFYSDPLLHHINRSRTSAASLSQNSLQYPRTPPAAASMPLHAEGCSSLASGKCNSPINPTGVIPQRGYSHHRVSLF